MGRYAGWMLLGTGLIFWSGCAGSQYDQGKKLLSAQDYAGATTALKGALAKDSSNVGLLVALGEALYHQGELAQAQTHLEKARRLAPGNSEAVAALGLVHERRGDTVAAIAAYRSYSEMSRLGKGRKIIKARLDRLIREQIQQDIKKALAQEAMLEVAAIPENALAVAPFRSLGTDTTLAPLRKGLAEMMITDLSKVPGLQVVERVRMQELMKEIGLGQSGAVDAQSAPRLGKLLGASKVVNGSFSDLGEKQVRLDLEVSGIKTGTSEQSQVSGPLEKLFRLQKELTFGIVSQMGIVLTAEQRDAIQEIPTENMLAFVAYSQGLDLEDQGKTQDAAAAFQQAASLDPQFGAAAEGVERAESAQLGTVAIGVVEGEVLGEQKATEAVDTATQDRLVATGMLAGAGFIPAQEGNNSEGREPVEEQESVDFGGAGVEVQVVVPLPPAGQIQVTGTLEP